MEVNGATTYSSPPLPPEPVTDKPVRVTCPLKPLMPLRLDGTLKAMSPIGTFPIVVWAVTLALPDRVRAALLVSVTVLSRFWNAPLLVDTSGTFLNDSGRLATFPVETPPSTFVAGIFNCNHVESMCS